MAKRRARKAAAAIFNKQKLAAAAAAAEGNCSFDQHQQQMFFAAAAGFGNSNNSNNFMGRFDGPFHPMMSQDHSLGGNNFVSPMNQKRMMPSDQFNFPSMQMPSQMMKQNQQRMMMMSNNQSICNNNNNSSNIGHCSPSSSSSLVGKPSMNSTRNHAILSNHLDSDILSGGMTRGMDLTNPSSASTNVASFVEKAFGILNTPIHREDEAKPQQSSVKPTPSNAAVASMPAVSSTSGSSSSASANHHNMMMKSHLMMNSSLSSLPTTNEDIQNFIGSDDVVFPNTLGGAMPVALDDSFFD